MISQLLRDIHHWQVKFRIDENDEDQAAYHISDAVALLERCSAEFTRILTQSEEPK